MDGQEFLSLDVRILIPHVEQEDDLGIFYNNSNSLDFVIVRQGVKVLRRALIGKFGNCLKPPYAKKRNRDGLARRVLQELNPTGTELRQDEFEEIIDQFIRSLFVSLDQGVANPIEYFRKYDNQPTLHRDCPPHYDVWQLEHLELLRDKIEIMPTELSLPPGKKEIFQEVRIYSRSSKILVSMHDYEKFLKGDTTPNSPLTIIDFVVVYSDGKVFFVESKEMNNATQRRIDKDKEIALRQLIRASLFFDYQFPDFFRDPVNLVRATVEADISRGMKTWEYTHFNFKEGDRRVQPLATYDFDRLIRNHI